MTGPALAAAVQPADGSRGAVRLPRLLLFAVVLAAFVYAYADVFRALWSQWNVNEANSHGVLIPLITAYLLWLERDRLTSATARPAAWAGLPLLLVSLGVLLIGRLAGIVGVQEVSMIGTLWGIVLLTAGWPAFRVAWFPIAYLLFMMPVWDLATEPMYRPLQLFAAWGTEALLSAFGIPVFREGTLLLLPNTTVEVAFACSGINFLMAVLAIGVVLAYILPRTLGRRLLIVGTALAVAVLSNPVRVAFIVYSFYSGIASPRQSHMWQGMTVSLGAFAFLFFAARRIAGTAAGQRGAFAAARLRPVAEGGWQRLLVPTGLACVLLAGAGLARPLDWPTPSLESLRLESVPSRVGEWQAMPRYRPAPPPRGIVLPDELWREVQTRGRAVGPGLRRAVRSRRPGGRVAVLVRGIRPGEPVQRGWRPARPAGQSRDGGARAGRDAGRVLVPVGEAVDDQPGPGKAARRVGRRDWRDGSGRRGRLHGRGRAGPGRARRRRAFRDGVLERVRGCQVIAGVSGDHVRSRG